MNRILYFLLFLITSVTSAIGAEGVQDFGWKSDPQAVKRVVAQTVGYKKQLQDLVRFNDEHDALNYRFLYQALEESGQLSNKEKQSGRLSALNQGRVGSCFMEDALITMSDGSQKNIKDVKVGDYIITANSDIHEVIQTFKRPYNGPMITVKLWGHSGVIMTADHQVYTQRGYVPAKDLLPTDMIGMPRRPLNGSDYINVGQFVSRDYLDGVTVSTSRAILYKQLPEIIKKDFDFGWMIGLYLAEGNTDGDKITWSMNINEKDTHITRLSNILNKYNIKYSIKELPEKSGIRLIINSVGYSQLFAKLCGCGSYNKAPHGELLTGPEEYLRGIYRGWLDGDGHARRNTEYGKTISRNLAFAMLSLDIALGNNGSISMQKGIPTGNVIHRYDSYQVGHVDSNADSWRVKSEEKIIWRKLRSIEQSEFNGFVYNLEIANDHSFIADGIAVHNCVGYSTTQALDVLSAVNVYHRPNLGQMWNVRFNPDATYGIGRQKNLGSWDGSTGAWSIEGISNLGTLHRLKYDKFDLTNTEPPQGRVWARDGMPADLLVFATDHKVTASAQVNTTEEAKAALQNGYTIIVCAQASYESKRDQQGFSRRTGDAWAHAMAVVAYRGPASGKEGFLIWNSWGDDWNSGGVYPDDQPEGSFWVTPEDLKFHLNQGDSWAIAGYDGFKQRNITWEEVFLIGEPIK